MNKPLDTRGIEPHGAGFRARIQVRGKRVATSVVPSVEEAIADRDALREALRTKRPPMTGGSVAEVGHRWLPTRKSLRAYANDKSRWSNHVLTSELAGMAVNAVRKGDVKAWLRGLEENLPAWKSRDNCLTLLRAFFADLVDDEVLSANPCDGVEVKGERATENPDEYLTPDEQQAILFATPLPDRFLVAFAMGIGMRRGEAFALHLADVHIDSAQPHVLVRYGSRRAGKYLTPKSRRVRFVRLFGLAHDAVRAQLAYLKQTKQPNPEGLLFPMPTGTKRDKPPESWPEARTVVSRFHVVWHSLRHVCASTLLFGWWDGKPLRLEDVSVQLGHSSIAMTQRYAKLAFVAHQWTKAPYVPKLFKDSEAPYPGLQVPKVALLSAVEAPAHTRPGATDRDAAVDALRAYLAGDPRWQRMALDCLCDHVPDLRAAVQRAWRAAR
jgi:integrase